MAPRTKTLAQKCSRQVREPSPPQEMEFAIIEHQQRLERLQRLKFGQTHLINSRTLEEIGLTDEVLELVTMGGWDQLLSICNLVHHDLTLEYLSSFTFDYSYFEFDKEDTISF